MTRSCRLFFNFEKMLIPDRPPSSVRRARIAAIALLVSRSALISTLRGRVNTAICAWALPLSKSTLAVIFASMSSMSSFSLRFCRSDRVAETSILSAASCSRARIRATEPSSMCPLTSISDEMLLISSFIRTRSLRCRCAETRISESRSLIRCLTSARSDGDTSTAASI